MTQETSAAIILAAGEGKRMKSKRAKVLHELDGRAMIDRVLDSIQSAGIEHLVVVTGHREEEVRKHLGDRARFVTQQNPEGTGHAVLQAEPEFSDFRGKILVACGDAPLLRSESIRAASEAFDELGAAALVLSTELEDPAGYGRIVRDDQGKVLGIVEHKDANEPERKIREINSGTYFFDGPLLFEALKKVTNHNAQGEYYLPDVLGILLGEGRRIGAYKMADAEEAMGVNTPEELALAEAALSRR